MAEGIGAVVERVAARLAGRIERRPHVMLVLGSGLGGLADEFEDAVRIGFEEIPEFPRAAVAGHRGALVAGRLEGVECVALQGRFHLYEGHPPERAALPVRVMARLGAGALLVTNAAGGANPQFEAGDLMLIEDHINLMGRSPLVGPVVHGDERFPDMTAAYDRGLRATAAAVAEREGIRLRSGVYCAVLGPSYETPAEVRMIRSMGADAIGMSTVPEVVTARAMRVPVLGVSLISNLAAGLTDEPLSHQEVLDAGAEARGRFQRLVRGVLPALEQAVGPR